MKPRQLEMIGLPLLFLCLVVVPADAMARASSSSSKKHSPFSAEAAAVLDCQMDRDCPPYYFCARAQRLQWRGTAASPRKCVTNYRRLPRRETTSCRNDNRDGKTFADHSICSDWEAENTDVFHSREATMRCFASLDYTCAKANFAPCTPNHDERGRAVPGETEACPHRFECRPRQFDRADGGGPIMAKVCVPKSPMRNYYESSGVSMVPIGGEPTCRTGWDCGYNYVLEKWTKCDGQCRWGL